MAKDKTTYESFLLSEKPIQLSFLEYQIVYQYIKQEKYIKSFNIIDNGRIVKKFYLENKVRFDERTDITEIIKDTLFKEIAAKNTKSKYDSKNKRNTQSKGEINEKARNEAALKLFTDMDL